MEPIGAGWLLVVGHGDSSAGVGIGVGVVGKEDRLPVRYDGPPSSEGLDAARRKMRAKMKEQQQVAGGADEFNIG